MFRDQAQALLDGKVDLFILETFRDLNEIGAAIAAVRSICDLPIVAQMTTEEDGLSLDGAAPDWRGSENAGREPAECEAAGRARREIRARREAGERPLRARDRARAAAR